MGGRRLGTLRACTRCCLHKGEDCFYFKDEDPRRGVCKDCRRDTDSQLELQAAAQRRRDKLAAAETERMKLKADIQGELSRPLFDAVTVHDRGEIEVKVKRHILAWPAELGRGHVIKGTRR